MSINSIVGIRHAGHPAPKAPEAPKPLDAPKTGAPTAAEGTHPGVISEIAKQRLEQGRIAEYTAGTPDPAVAAAGAPSYFRSYEQLKGDLFKLQEKYPNLVEVMDIGDSADKVRGTANRDILNLRLTNKALPADGKARAVHVAGQHAREIANPELAMRFVDQLLKGYGTDPEATAMLDTRVVDVIPIMNPDGHVVVENGYAKNNSQDLWQRKNTTPPDGTDLNRNWDFHWGGQGASSNPHSETYRGASAASEPEVKAIQNFISTGQKPGMFIDWHSYSELNLYPWGDTRTKAPDHDGLKAVAERFSEFNNYTSQPAIDLYPTTGTSIDFAYGTQKIPSFTVETGRSFHQDAREFERVWGENGPVFNYSTKIADKPYERAKGPQALDVLVQQQSGKLTAQISDFDANDTVAGAEFVFSPSTAEGAGVALSAADGAFDGARELVNGSLPTAAEGQKLVYVRARDAAGNWGPLSAQWLQVPTGPAAAPVTAPPAPATPASVTVPSA